MGVNVCNRTGKLSATIWAMFDGMTHYHRHLLHLTSVSTPWSWLLWWRTWTNMDGSPTKSRCPTRSGVFILTIQFMGASGETSSWTSTKSSLLISPWYLLISTVLCLSTMGKTFDSKTPFSSQFPFTWYLKVLCQHDASDLRCPCAFWRRRTSGSQSLDLRTSNSGSPARQLHRGAEGFCSMAWGYPLPHSSYPKGWVFDRCTGGPAAVQTLHGFLFWNSKVCGSV